MRDLTGAFDDDGNPIADGAPDNPEIVLWYQPTRTGQKDNYNLSVGVSATWSRPQDKKLQQLCKEAAESQIAMQRQLTANKRLDFELARLKTCANLMKEEFTFTPRVLIIFYVCRCGSTKCNSHQTTCSLYSFTPSVSESHVSESAADLGAPLRDSTWVFLPRKAAIFFSTFFTAGFTAFNRRSARGFASSAEVVATTAIEAVAVTVPALGRFPTI